MPAVSRELSVVYGTTTIGGTSSIYLLDGPVSIDEGPDEANVSFRFSMYAANEADFDTQIAALETAFRTPRQNLTVTQGSATIYSFSHSGNTGFDAEPVIRKLSDDLGDSGRSRSYEVTIRLGVPADVYSQSGRRHARVSVDYSPGRRRTISFSGEWAVQAAGSAARTSYLAGVATYCNSVLSSLGGTWEVIDEVHDENETNKVLAWRRVYGEIVANQSSGNLNDASLVDSQLTIVVGIRAPGDSPGKDVVRLREVSISYSTWVDVDVTKNLSLRSKWTSTIRPHLMDLAAQFAQGSTVAVVSEDPQFDWFENRITASMSLLVAGEGDVLEYRRSEEINDQDLGTVFVPAWDGGDGFACYEYAGVRQRYKSVTETIKRLDSGAEGTKKPGRKGSGKGKKDVRVAVEISKVGARWVPVTQRLSTTPIRIGTLAENIDVVEEAFAQVFRWSRALEASRGRSKFDPPVAVTEG